MTELKWDKEVLDLGMLLVHANGDKQKIFKYLDMFRDLIPERLEMLEGFRKEGNRRKIRQCLHQMIPQLEFFGIQEGVRAIKLIGSEYVQLDHSSLNRMLDGIVEELEKASEEVNRILEVYFH